MKPTHATVPFISKSSAIRIWLSARSISPNIAGIKMWLKWKRVYLKCLNYLFAILAVYQQWFLDTVLSENDGILLLVFKVKDMEELFTTGDQYKVVVCGLLLDHLRNSFMREEGGGSSKAPPHPPPPQILAAGIRKRRLYDGLLVPPWRRTLKRKRWWSPGCRERGAPPGHAQLLLQLPHLLLRLCSVQGKNISEFSDSDLKSIYNINSTLHTAWLENHARLWKRILQNIILVKNPVFYRPS